VLMRSNSISLTLRPSIGYTLKQMDARWTRFWLMPATVPERDFLTRIADVRHVIDTNVMGTQSSRPR
jgi:hypothetical protein